MVLYQGRCPHEAVESESYFGGGWAKRGVASGFRGWMAIVSDPVDLLCKAAFMAARGMIPLGSGQSNRGYGLGVITEEGAI